MAFFIMILASFLREPHPDSYRANPVCIDKVWMVGDDPGVGHSFIVYKNYYYWVRRVTEALVASYLMDQNSYLTVIQIDTPAIMDWAVKRTDVSRENNLILPCSRMINHEDCTENPWGVVMLPHTEILVNRSRGRHINSHTIANTDIVVGWGILVVILVYIVLQATSYFDHTLQQIRMIQI